MNYPHIKEAVFLARPNRFIAEIWLDGKTEIAHVKNTGRCKELLVPHCKVLVDEAENLNRKTKYDLISVYKGDRLINMDSQAPNKIFGEWIKSSGHFGEVTLLKPESTYGSSRFDFYIEAEGRKIYAEVKGVTLEEDGVVLFPDAPTERGVKHIGELCRCINDGYEAYIIFIIQMENVLYFTPNNRTHKAFGEALKQAQTEGVHILALDCVVTETGITAKNPVEVRL